MNTKTLTTCILPISGICTDTNLYFLSDGQAVINDKLLHIHAGAIVDFGVYFNVFSLGKWRKHTDVQNVSLAIDFEGQACIEIWHATLEGIRTKLITKEIWNRDRDEISISIEKYTSLDDGLLFFTVSALLDVVWHGAKFTTSSIPAYNPKVGIVITTYQREAELKRNVLHLVEGLGDSLGADIDLIVVDNGKTLAPDDVKGAKLLPNRNLGGSGGFMRGLLHCEEAGKYSHCLFMDDDAFCEVESIFRVIAFMSFAKKENTAVAGAMLDRGRPHIQYENTAYLDTLNHPIHHDFDLHDFQKICENEVEEQHEQSYGAWWFFMFPIASVSHYAFPFFVRGDDILFGLTNDFTLITLNGVSCWHPNFAEKESPLIKYLAMRSIFMINTILRKNTFMATMVLLWILFKEILFYSFTYRYEFAPAIFEAFSDYMKGPDFWCEHIDMVYPKERINALNKTNTDAEHEHERTHAYCMTKEPTYPRYLFIFLCIITLGGHLLPDRFLDMRRDWSLKLENKGLVRLYWRKKYMTIIDNTGKVAYKMNRKVFFQVLWRFLSTCICNSRKFFKMYNSYHKNFDKLTSRDFWRRQLFEKNN